MSLDAHRCPNGHLTSPPHPRCPACGEEQTDAVDLSDRTAEIVTWTESQATPPGVRQPNAIAIVEFDVDGERVRQIGQLTDADVEIGDSVRPVHVDELRDPAAGIRHPDSQSWDGYRFEPV
ncbi:MAG: Zn-ribbon domain-containing OB-fold protein [Halobacteriaceae archaeon]